MPDHEIIVVGDFRNLEGLVYIPAVDDAASGRLGAMRNRAVERARFENIVILDDDIILTPDWVENFQAFDPSFDIMTSRVRLPDGTRYWDYASFGGPRNQILLDWDERDEHVYMSGGAAWVMKSKVARSVRWNSDLEFYQEEDVQFSRQCRKQGFKISHNPGCVAYHYSSSYTRIARVVCKRRPEHNHLWLQEREERNDPKQLISLGLVEAKDGYFAELGDCLRSGLQWFPGESSFHEAYTHLMGSGGGDVKGDCWYSDGDPYFKALLEELDPGIEYLGKMKFSAEELRDAEKELDRMLKATAARETLTQIRRDFPALTTLMNLQLEKARNSLETETVTILENLREAADFRVDVQREGA